jgi:hypothetical protein
MNGFRVTFATDQLQPGGRLASKIDPVGRQGVC